ncbi:hypothetical protein DLAC_04611 [Tieghemostelium lacteum]|uniref:Uncharacterized protein n=1 Tax=Tieghemostelium lacteum TaxID=361077 RepID=A0A151ZK08_TIELA|nr:hypothetical protein DLAC_04611 [Tieghemostelium lacteum]|eukprot:KYQ94313.1 hypothetical protein DLAC_04611 [Tieghemostelium lacteum]
MSNNSNSKVKLQQLLNECLNLKVEFKTKKSLDTKVIQELKTKSEECIQLSKDLKIEHGRANALELLSFAEWYELVIKNQNSTNEHIEILKELSEPIEQKLLESKKLAISFNDKALYLRVLETLTNIYNKTNQMDKEIEILEKIVHNNLTSSIGAEQRSLPMSVMLLNAILKKLNFIYQDRDRIYQLPRPQPQTDSEGKVISPESDPTNIEKTDPFMKLHLEAWENYQWIKKQPSNPFFQKDQYIHQNKSSLFKLCIYCGSLANPLISGKDPEVIALAMEAFQEAFYIADLIQDKEYFCAATAHRSSVLYQTLSEDEGNKLLQSLKDVEAKMKPKNSEIRDLIHSIENKAPTLHPEEKEKEDQQKSQEKEK